MAQLLLTSPIYLNTSYHSHRHFSDTRRSRINRKLYIDIKDSSTNPYRLCGNRKSFIANINKIDVAPLQEPQGLQLKAELLSKMP